MSIKALVALKKGCVFCHCKFLLEMAIDEDRNLDSEAEDAVAKVTDCKVNDQDGGWGRQERKTPSVVNACIWQRKKGKDIPKCPYDDDKDNVEDE